MEKTLFGPAAGKTSGPYPSGPALALHGVAKFFAVRGARVRALDGVSLEAKPGEFTVLKGRSGSGKSTLLLAAGGLAEPSEGEVRVNGENPYALSPDARARFRARSIGFVFQQFHLIPYLTVLENALTASVAAPRPDALERAEALLERFGMAHRLSHLSGELSTGEKQRVALARALLHQPPLLLADEPTGNLDRQNADLVFRHLRDYVDQGGCVLMASHDGAASEVATRVLEMEKGKFA